ncbi:hypothetical protein Hdeb2414_s0001g00033531 [Helianthus debilis subsp. tardiflorus]
MHPHSGSRVSSKSLSKLNKSIWFSVLITKGTHAAHSRTPRYLCKVKHFDQICNDEVLSISDFSTNDNISIFFRDSGRNPSPHNGCFRVYEGLMNSAACTGGNHLRKFDPIFEVVYIMFL